jgi:hypothetical protein
LAFSPLDPKELITVSKNLIANLLVWLERREYQLQMITRLEHPAEFAIFLGELLNILNKALHGSSA